MASKYDDATAALYRAPFDAFVAERKRLSTELEAAGDKAGAARLSKMTRPPVSAWAVNQLYWQDKKAFAALFRTAERLRDPNPAPADTVAHRDAVTGLRARAAKLLANAKKSATESTLRRVTLTLTALAATGGFEPDPPGALKGDRDPPGFDVVGLGGTVSGKRHPAAAGARNGSGAKAKPTKREAATEERRKKTELVAERRRVERELKQKAADRERLERKLRIATGVFEARKEEVTRLKEKLVEAADAVEGARGVVRELEKELGKSSRPLPSKSSR